MNKTEYTTKANNLNPNFVTGFCDAESCFRISISKNPRYLLGWNVKLIFSIHLHSKDIDTLYLIQRFFGVGNVTIHGDSAMYEVLSIKDLVCVIEHFNKYPLKTQKYADFILFKKAFDIVNNKNHLTKEGLRELVSIRASINKGLPERLQVAFPDVTPILRPQVKKTTLESNTPEVKHWVAGFVTGEGCFFIKTSKSKTHKLGIGVTLNFFVTQNIRDTYLLESFVQVFGCGSFSIAEKSGIGKFAVTNSSHIIEKIIPFFEEYPILGAKAEDFRDFKEASVLIKSKAHLTKEGLDKILLIKSRMNFKRNL